MHLLPIILLSALAPLAAQTPPVVERTLPNGMRLLLVERPGDPSIVCGWVARVGSAQDGLDTTGLAHMAEHMMFKGTRTLGTRDAVKDAELNARQDELQVGIRQEVDALQVRQRRGEITDALDPKVRTPRLQSLMDAFQETVKAQRALAVPNEIRGIYTRAGATRLNAGTGSDWTVYLVNLPANKLELWCWLESDRLIDPVLREFYTERDVVREERRSSVEGDPTGEVFERFGAMIWQAHPYQWTTFSAIGWPAPLSRLTREQSRAFLRTFYAPGNLTAILVGGFRADEAETLVQRYFGRLQANPEGVPPVVAQEPLQMGEQRLTAAVEAAPRYVAAFKAPGAAHADTAALRVLERLLNERLEPALVHGSGVATSARARLDLRAYGSLAFLEVAPSPGRKAEEVEAALEGFLANLQKADFTEEELVRARRRVVAAHLEQAEEPRALVWALADAECYGTWRDWEAIPKRVEAVTAPQVRQVAARVFRRENRNVLVLNRASRPEENR